MIADNNRVSGHFSGFHKTGDASGSNYICILNVIKAVFKPSVGLAA